MDFDYNVEKQEITVELNTPKIELDTPSGGRGLKGDTGNPGTKGDPGDPGTPGKDGEAATITVGSTTTGDAGTDASVTNSGTTSAAVLDFTIPKGDKGDTGPAGQDGQDGQDGTDGISPIITTSKSGKTTTITIVDAEGTKTATILDGNDGASTWGDITGDIEDQTDLNTALGGKQDTLVSGTNIKTINNTSLLGSGNLSLASAWGDITGTLSNQTDLQNALDGKAEKSLYGDTTINVGRKANTTVGNYSTAEGRDTTASGKYSHAEGFHTSASKETTHAEGAYTTADGNYSHAEGYQTTASGIYSHAEGYYTVASGNSSHAEGYQTKADSKYQHVSGKYNISDANDTYAEIIGNGTANNARSNARTLDWGGNEVLAGKLTVGTGPTNNLDVATKKYVDDAISGGGGTATDVKINGTSITSNDEADIKTQGTYNATTNKIATMSDLPTVPTKVSDLTNDAGYTTNTGTITSVKMNGSTVSSSGEADLGTVLTSHQNIKTINSTSLVGTGDVSVQPTLVSGTNIKTINSSSILGSGDVALSTATNLENGTGTGSVKTVSASLAAGDYSFAEGRYTTANSSYSHVEGNGTTTNGSYSHAEGLGSWTAQGGTAAHAEGHYTTARGYSSHSEGYYTEAASTDQHVQGKYNIVDSSGVYADIVGNGTDDNNRSNAYTLDWSGNGVYAGKVTVGSAPTANMDVATKQYVDNSVPSNADIVDLIYPVGSLYMSTNATSPATLFGGSWTQLEDRFLLGAGSTYTAGDTGGEATHTLTIDEMPRHTHKLFERYNSGANEWRLESGQNKSRWHDEFCGATGGDQPHNNMPPYLVVYMWERTA